MRRLTAPLFFSLPSLQTTNAYQTLLKNLSRPPDFSAALHVLPHLLQSFIEATHRARYELFTQSSSSRLSYDVFVAQKERDSVRLALAQAFEWMTVLESSEAPPTLFAQWQCRCAVWQVISSWGGYLETEDAWSELVYTDARRVEAVLTTLGESSTDNEDLTGQLLRTMATLEGLDHASAAVGSLVLGCSLAVRDLAGGDNATLPDNTVGPPPHLGSRKDVVIVFTPIPSTHTFYARLL